MTFPGSKKEREKKLNSPLMFISVSLEQAPSHLKRRGYFNKNNLIKSYYGLYARKKENAKLKFRV